MERSAAHSRQEILVGRADEVECDEWEKGSEYRAEGRNNLEEVGVSGSIILKMDLQWFGRGLRGVD